MTETLEGGDALARERDDGARSGIKAAEALKARAEAVRTWAQAQSEVAKDWASARAGKVKAKIKEEPVIAVTVGTVTAFVAGAVVGIVIGRLTAN